jgi:glycosyltransferase involved in cell wall biosynthesis
LSATVSFIIAAFNEQKYLRECIESCLQQEHVSVEVCVTDDGSTDDTWNVIESFKDDYRVKGHRFAKNKGKVSAFNQSFKMASGDYIALIGADDLCEPHRALEQVQFVESEKLDLCWSAFSHIDGQGQPMNKEHIFNQNPGRRDILIDNFIPGNTVFFNRKLSKVVFPIPEQLKFEDWWIAFHGIYHFRYRFLNKKLVRYRLHDQNTVGNQDQDYVRIRRKNIRRHGAYHDLFTQKLSDPSLIRLNRLVKNYKEVCLSDSFVYRVGILFQSLFLLSIRDFKVSAKMILVSLFGLKFLSLTR